MSCQGMPGSVYRVIGRFGDHELAIWRLYGDDPDFRELCDDYLDVLDALERVRSGDYRREFEQLKAALEEEIASKMRGANG